jgi:hypothetical protein
MMNGNDLLLAFSKDGSWVDGKRLKLPSNGSTCHKNGVDTGCVTGFTCSGSATYGDAM